MTTVLTLEQLGRVIISASRAFNYQIATGKKLPKDSYGGSVEVKAAAFELVQSAGGTEEGFYRSVTVLLGLHLPNGVDTSKLSTIVEKATEPAHSVFKNDKITVEFLDNGSKRVTLHCKGKILTDMADTIPERGYGFDPDLKEDPTYREGGVISGKPIVMKEDVSFVIDATQSSTTIAGLKKYGKGEISALVVALAEAEYRIATNRQETLFKDAQGRYFDLLVKEYTTEGGYSVCVVLSIDSEVYGCLGPCRDDVVRARPSNS